MGSAPPDRFKQAAQQAIQQVPTDEYNRHVQPRVSESDPLGRLPYHQRIGIAESLLGAPTGSGTDANQISQNAGIRNLDPGKMSPEELASLLQWTKQNNPNALSHVATQYRDKPDILHAILGNRALMGLAIGLGAKVLSDQMSRGHIRNQGPRPMISPET